MHSDFETGLSPDTPSITDRDFRRNERENLLQAGPRTAPAAKRKWPRFAVDMSIEVRLATQGPTRMVACEGRGTDISFGGLAVTADIDLPVGAQVGVEFTLPHSDRPLIFRCFVRNRNGNCYGMEFILENDDDYRNAGELHPLLAATYSDARK